jgi:hypothetical protein
MAGLVHVLFRLLGLAKQRLERGESICLEWHMSASLHGKAKRPIQSRDLVHP